MKKLIKQNGRKILAVVLSAIIIIGCFSFVSGTEKKAKADNTIYDIEQAINNTIGANYFNINNVNLLSTENITGYKKNDNFASDITIITPKNSTNQSIATNLTLNELCNNLLTIGENYRINFDTTSTDKKVLINDVDEPFWIETGTNFTLTTEMANSRIWFYGLNKKKQGTGTCYITNIRITKGYENYDYQPNYMALYETGYNIGYNNGINKNLEKQLFSKTYTNQDIYNISNDDSVQTRLIQTTNEEIKIQATTNSASSSIYSCYVDLDLPTNQNDFSNSNIQIQLDRTQTGGSTVEPITISLYDENAGELTTLIYEAMPENQNIYNITIPELEENDFYFIRLGFMIVTLDDNDRTITITLNLNINNSISAINEELQQTIYDTGYTDGVNSINQDITNTKNDAYNDGYNTGYLNGTNAGYSQGKIDGAASANEYTFLGLLTAVIDAPIQVLLSVFQIGSSAENDFFGINLANLIQMLFTLMVIVLVIKFVMSR